MIQTHEYFLEFVGYLHFYEHFFLDKDCLSFFFDPFAVQIDQYILINLILLLRNQVFRQVF